MNRTASRTISWLFVVVSITSALLISPSILCSGTVRAAEPLDSIGAEGPTIARGASAPRPNRTEPQRSGGYVAPPFDTSHLGVKQSLKSASLLASQFDWRTLGVVTSVKDQGSCGSCYAFATLASIESRLARQGLGLLDLSENYVKECNWEELSGVGVGSCLGGDFFMVANLLSQTGTVQEACNPYVPWDVACQTTCPHVTRFSTGGSLADRRLPA